MTIGSLVTVIGLYVIAEGILAIVNGVLGKTPTRLWTIARGDLAVLIGIFVAGHSFLVAGLTTMTIMYSWLWAPSCWEFWRL